MIYFEWVKIKIKKKTVINLGITIVLFTALTCPIYTNDLDLTIHKYNNIGMMRKGIFIQKGWSKAKVYFETLFGSFHKSYDGIAEIYMYDSDYAWRYVDRSQGFQEDWYNPDTYIGIWVKSAGQFYSTSDPFNYFFVKTTVTGWFNGAVPHGSSSKEEIGDVSGSWTLWTTTGNW